MTACYLVKQLYDTELHCMSRCCIEEMLEVSVHTHTYMYVLCHMSLICECEQCERKKIFFFQFPFVKINDQCFVHQQHMYFCYLYMTYINYIYMNMSEDTITENATSINYQLSNYQTH